MRHTRAAPRSASEASAALLTFTGRLFLLFTTLSVCASFFLVILAPCYSIGINRAVRDSDKVRVALWRIPYLKIDINTLAVLPMGLSVMFLCASLAVLSFEGHGTIVGLILTLLVFPALASAAWLGRQIMYAGHVFYYWRRIGHVAAGERKDPVDLKLIDDMMQMRFKISKQLHDDYLKRPNDRFHVGTDCGDAEKVDRQVAQQNH